MDYTRFSHTYLARGCDWLELNEREPFAEGEATIRHERNGYLKKTRPNRNGYLAKTRLNCNGGLAETWPNRNGYCAKIRPNCNGYSCKGYFGKSTPYRNVIAAERQANKKCTRGFVFMQTVSQILTRAAKGNGEYFCADVYSRNKNGASAMISLKTA